MRSLSFVSQAPLRSTLFSGRCSAIATNPARSTRDLRSAPAAPAAPSHRCMASGPPPPAESAAEAQSSVSTPRIVSAPPGPCGLSKLSFTDSFVSTLPADPELANFVRRSVRDSSFSFVLPTSPAEDDQRKLYRLRDPEGEAAAAPQLPRGMVAWSTGAAELLDLSADAAPEGAEEEAAVNVLGGFGDLWPGMRPYAQCYSGHQFGSFAGQLGDGRAITLGEYVNKAGERYELQLKGAGKTPYSRTADGRAVLRSSIREFLCSEAMHSLGIPTTRALSLVSTGAGVIRDMFYSGNPQFENGAICSRVAPSFLRVGSFENPASVDERDRLRATADYAIEYHFPELMKLPADVESEGRNRYTAFLSEVVRRNAEMVAKWQGVGFVHGVLNSDNTSILGLTIDYGPYGFLDAYNPQYTPNTTDMPGGRYRYEMQPMAIHWNLSKMASSMVSLCGLADAQMALNEFDDVYNAAYNKLFACKLGVSEFTEEDGELVKSLCALMEESGADFTGTWRSLSQVTATSATTDLDAVYAPLIAGKPDVDADKWASWMARYQKRVQADAALDDDARREMMNATNPVYILRNYMAQEAIDAANKGDFSLVRELYELLRDPYTARGDGKYDRYTEEPPSWASRPGVCVNSCSS